MTTLYGLSWGTDGPAPGGKHETFTTSETKAKARGRVLAKERNETIELHRWTIADKRDMPWVCDILSTEDFETGQRVKINTEPGELLATFEP